MSTRILSAYFNDFRQGTKDFAALRDFLMTCYRQDPMRRSHLLHWMDQAQYEHPIPVTDFLMLRREVEGMLKSGVELEEPDDATMVVSTGNFTAAAPPPGDEDEDEDEATRVVDSTAPSATAVTEAVDAPTLIAGTGTDSTPLPERSDHAGFHDAATSLSPGSTATLVDATPAPAPPPQPKPLQSRRPVLILGITVAATILVAAAAGRYWLQPDSAVDTQASSSTIPTPAPAPAPAPTTNVTPSASTAPSAPNQQAVTPPPQIEDDTTLATLDADGLLEQIKKRVQAGQLLPTSAPGSAYVPLNELIKRFPDSPLLIKARILLKDAHLKLSAQAREKGDWDEAQRQLDAAFNVLQPTATSATAPAQPGS